VLKAQLLSSQAKTLATKPTPKQTATHTDNISRKQPGKVDTGKHAPKHGMRDKERDKDRQMSMCDTKGGRSEGGGALEKDAEMSRESGCKALRTEALWAFNQAILVCEQEQLKPHLHLAQFESVLMPHFKKFVSETV